MAIPRGVAATLTVQLPGATAPVTATIDGVATGTAPALVTGTKDSYTFAVTAAEMDASTPYVLATDAAGEEYGFTLDTDEDNGGGISWTYRVLLDTDGDGVADVPEVGIPNITCTLTSDLAGTVQIASAKVSDSRGNATWHGLAAGTYYVWREGPGFSGTNPDVEVVS